MYAGIAKSGPRRRFFIAKQVKSASLLNLCAKAHESSNLSPSARIKKVIDLKRWEILGYVAAVFDPVPTGLLAGYFLYKEKFKKTGKVVMALSVVWFAVILALSLMVQAG